MVKFIINALAQEYHINPEEDVVFTSFTGKATLVLQKKGNKNISTLHKLLYNHYPLPNGGYKRERITHLDYKIVIVDECSMVPMSLFKDLARHKNLYVICLGDPGQLPPIHNDENNHLLDHPHIFLDEIMRQAAESEIIQLTMKIRNDEPIPYMKGKEVQVLRSSELNTGMLTWADQVLCATNQTRLDYNNKIRKMLGREGDPQDGDKMICLHNYWEVFSDNKNALVNGTVGFLKNPYISYMNIFPYQTIENSSRMPYMNADFITDAGEEYKSLNLDKHLIDTGKNILNWKNSYRMGKNSRLCSAIPKEFSYGYAITRT